MTSKKIFLEFYEYSDWAKAKWASGTAAVSHESLLYMRGAIDERNRARTLATGSTEYFENEQRRIARSIGPNVAPKLRTTKRRNRRKPTANAAAQADGCPSISEGINSPPED